MKLAHPFIQLPLAFDAALMAKEVRALGEAPWRGHPQDFAGNTMLPLIAVNGDPNETGFRGPMGATPYLQRCPYLQHVMNALGVTLGRSRLMRLDGGAEVARHADQGYYWVDRLRVHVPIETQPGVRFVCGDAEVHMRAGECWIFDTWRQHTVLNERREQRIHLVVDTVGGEAFWDHVSRGRPHPPLEALPDWAPARIEPAGAPGPLAIETCNVPEVMSPWELEANLGALLREGGRHPGLPAIYAAASRVTRAWRALWARYGDSPEGRPVFRSTLRAFFLEIHEGANAITLPNECVLFGAIVTRLGSAAVNDAQGERASGDRG